MGRLNFILRTVFTEAIKRDELDRLTTKTGRDQVDLLRRCGLG